MTETIAETGRPAHVAVVATWNVNSIRARLERLLTWLNTRRPDVLCLQETKVTDDDFPLTELRDAGYQAVISGQRTYNGVAILARDPPVDVVRGFNDGVEDPQSRFIVATAATPAGPIRVASVYVPNGSAVGTDKFTYKLNWLGRWKNWLEAQAASNQPTLLCGDFNIAPEDRDVCDPAAWAGQVLCHPDERAALDAIRTVGYQDFFRRLHPDLTAFSWWDYRRLAFPRNQGLRIDHIYGSPSMAERCLSVVIDRETRKGKLPSDHAPVLAEIASPQ
jgi:exodeoxyribonuclease III